MADTNNHRIQKFTPDGQFMTMFGRAGSGPRQLSSPWKVTVASNGYVYILDFSNQRIQVFRPVN